MFRNDVKLKLFVADDDHNLDQKIVFIVNILKIVVVQLQLSSLLNYDYKKVKILIAKEFLY